MTTRAQRTQWRNLRGQGMTSAIGEYTPSEFWELLDEVEDLTVALRELSSAVESKADLGKRRLITVSPRMEEALLLAQRILNESSAAERKE